MYKLVLSSNFEKQLRKLVKHNVVTKSVVDKTLGLLKREVNYPSLRLHKLSGGNYWSVSVTRSIRLVFRMEKNEIYCIKIGTHDEVY